MQFSLHIFFALAALAFVSAAVILGASDSFVTATPGGVALCRVGHEPCGATTPAGFREAANAIAR